MKSGVMAAWVACTVAMARVGAAAPESPAPGLRVLVETRDGSSLYGVPVSTSMTVHADFGPVVLSLARVASIALRDDNEGAVVHLANGDRLTGIHNLGSLSIKTLFGPVEIDAKHIKRVTCMAGLSAQVPTKGLVLRFAFDADTGPEVRSEVPGGLTGKVTGARWTPQGKAGGAMEFDGNDFIDLGNPAALQFTRDFTVAAWVLADDVREGRAILSKSHGYPEQHRRGIELQLTSASVNAYFWDEQTRYFSGNAMTTTFQKPEWHHVVMQHDSSLPEHQMRIFVDGVPQSVQFGYEVIASIPVVRNVAEPWRIGCFRPGVAPFKGKIDEVVFYNRVLSGAEVAQLYEAAR